MKKEGFVGMLEIVLLVASVFSFAFILEESSRVSAAPLDSIPGGIENFLKSEKNQPVVCSKTITGEICQKMTKGDCELLCEGDCLSIDGMNDCTIGTCYDAEEGLCEPNSGKKSCEELGGEWYPDAKGNINKCEKHCCVLNDEARFTTERECQKLGKDMGIEPVFDTSFLFESDCIYLVQGKKKGACVLEESELAEGKKNCKLLSRDECDLAGGEFHENLLCSHPSLNTVCERQSYTGCVEGLDEVYWFDSCGNRENIFDIDKEKSWNEGKIMYKSESCEIGNSRNWLKNQRTCGNCNRLLGSTCGNETSGQELNDNPDGGVVCIDLGCEASEETGGIRRENGESWCDYQSQFGVPVDIPFSGAVSYFFGGFKIPGAISADPPGARYFRKSCVEGEVKTEQCGDYRNAICVESRVEKKDGGGEISTASCRLNRWQECLNYNKADDGALGPIMQIAQLPYVGQILGRTMKPLVEAEKYRVAQMMLKCEADPDCFVNSVSVPDSDFKFPICMGKYAPGFYRKGEETGGKTICSYASNTCASVWVKKCTAFTFGTTAKWECVANCGCVEGDSPGDAKPSQQFVQQMHDLCISLGDCGMDFNYKNELGGVGTGYSLTKKEYDGLPKQSQDKGRPTFGGVPIVLPRGEPIPGKYIEENYNALSETLERGGSNENLLRGNSEESESGESGISTGGTPDFKPYNPNNGLLIMSLSSGGASIAVSAMASAGWLGKSASAAGGVATSSVSGKTTTWILDFIPIPDKATTITPPVSSEIATTLPASADALPLGTPSGGSIGLVGDQPAGSIAGITPGTFPPAGEPPPAGPIEPLPISEAASGSISPAAAGFSAFMIGGSIGMAATSLLVGISGIGAGVGPAGVIAYSAAGFVGGGMIALSIAPSMAEAGLLGSGQMATALAGMKIAPWVGPAGIAVMVITIADIIANWVADCGEIKTVEVSFECKPWQPPAGGANCEKCGEDGRPCSRYACETLGQSCTFIAEEPNAICVDESPNDISAPKILGPLESAISEGFSYDEVKDSGFKIKGDKCISQYEQLRFGIKLDEYGRCRIGGSPDAKFEEMIDFGGSNSLKKEHVHIFTYGDLNALGIEAPPVEEESEINLYVKCQDSKEHTNTRSYEISFCMKRLDYTPPMVELNQKEYYVPYGTEEKEIVIFTAEETEIRWSLEEKDFDDMENEFHCEETDLGFECKATIPLETDETEICIKAKDHPEWSGTDREGDRNENVDCLNVLIKKASAPLEIVSVKPDGDVIKSGEVMKSIDIEVETRGGMEDSTACFVGANRADLLPKVSKNIHKKTYETFSVGEHTLQIKCEDAAGNTAEATTTFTIMKDLKYPKITRVYEDNGELVVITDEDGECAFVNEKQEGMSTGCNFEFDEGRFMRTTGDKRKEHRIELDKKKTYYIKCKDDYGNLKGGCDVIVKQGII